ncbi:hypothetical protein Tco_0879054 [Tanacetum coccineum]
METKDTLSLCSDSEEQQMQLMQDKAKESCMVSFRRLHLHLKLLSNNDLKGTRTEYGFKRAFATLFGQDLETFTGRIFKTVGFRWVPTGKIFTSSTTNVDSESLNGSNEDITNHYECEQTLDVSLGTLNLSVHLSILKRKDSDSKLGTHDHDNEQSSSKLVPKVVPPADKTATSQQEMELLFSPMYE